MSLALIQSLFYPPQTVHVDGVDLLNDVRSILQNLIMKILVRRLGPLQPVLLLTSHQLQLRPELDYFLLELLLFHGGSR